jgi:nicotinamide mononucleotide transporter
MMNVIEAIAVVFGLAAVWLTVRQNVWCWPAGLIQVLLYIFIFLESKLYSDMLLHMLYVGFQIYGWYHWLHGGENSSTLQISTLRYRSAWIGTVILGGLLWGFFMTSYTDAAAPYPDAFIAVASITAQWLTTRKKIESWYFWIFVDVVAIAVYWYKGLYLTTGLYTIFLVMCILGFQQWRQKLPAAGPLVFIEELP